jgi:D-alanine--poly(phosphoribitol) ligase subunit 1
MNFLSTLLHNFHTKKENKSFCINNEFFTYQDLGNAVANIVEQLNSYTNHIQSKSVAVVCTNHINTYAGLIACWISGYSYVPLGLHNPDERNIGILEDASIGIILSSKKLNQQIYSNYTIIDTANIFEEHISLSLKCRTAEEDLAYILFTSGSTGKPKGVPISFKNLSSFLEAFEKTPFAVTENDKCLQMFELTFDVSVSSYLPALVAGACIYTVADDGIKYLNVLKVINEHHLTSIQIVPSIIRLGIPLLNKLHFTSVKQCILTGEATSIELLEKWKPVVTNAAIYDFYGPTECTIYCSFYQCNTNFIKHYNGMLCIGKPFYNTEMKIVDGVLNEVRTNQKGELLIYSPQLTKGYINNKEKNKESFVNIGNKSYYKSGDMCYRDEDGDIYYCGRYDNQVKIQGFRVELSEVEFKTKEAFGLNNVAITIVNKVNATELILVIEKMHDDAKANVIEKLKTVLPIYMIPKEIISIDELPLNTSGKTDRVKVKQMVNEYFAK